MNSFRHCSLVIAITIGVGLVIAALEPALAQRLIPNDRELAAIGLMQHTIRIGAVTRTFLVGGILNPKRPAPVIIVLHGGTQSMRKLFSPEAGATLEWASLTKREGAILLVPNGTAPRSGDPFGDVQSWSAHPGKPVEAGNTNADDIGFILAMLDWANTKYRTDRSRIYLTGASNGGHMTLRLLREAPGPFAAAAAFLAGTTPGTASASVNHRPTPLLIARGTKDPLVKWEGGNVGRASRTVTSAQETLAWWLAANRAGPSETSRTLLPDADPQDGCRIERTLFAARQGGAPVEFIAMRGGGHALPSIKHRLPDRWLTRYLIGNVCRDVEGVELTWAFLSAHTLRGMSDPITGDRGSNDQGTGAAEERRSIPVDPGAAQQR